MAPPLRKWGTSGYVGGEVNAVLPMRDVLDVVARVIGEGFETNSNVVRFFFLFSFAIFGLHRCDIDRIEAYAIV